MPLRAEQWLVLGFTAVGGYALYRLLTNPAAPKASLPSDEEKQKTPILIPKGTPSIVPAIPQSLVKPDGTANLKTGVTYNGRIELHAPGTAVAAPAGVAAPRLFELLTEAASKGELAAELVRGGFANPAVYTYDEAAAGAIPLFQSIEGAGSGSRWFSGKWAGPEGTRDVGNVVLIWPTAT